MRDCKINLTSAKQHKF